MLFKVVILILIGVFNGRIYAQQLEPCPRNKPVIAYNEADNAIYLFGGYCSVHKKKVNDLWKYEKNKWIQIYAEVSPSPRSGHAMIYDSQRNSLIVFGGKNENSELLNDTWQFKNNNWSLIAENAAPSIRQSHALAYDSKSGSVYMFGGSNSLKESLNDTWVLKNQKWNKLNSKFSPPPRLQHAMCYDSKSENVVLFGGFDRKEDGKNIYYDTWELENNNWVLKSENQNLARDHHAMSYSHNSESVILFGGYNNGYLGDTWSWNGEQWMLLTDAGPSKRAGKPGLVYNVAENAIVLFGGWGETNKPLMDFWIFNSKVNKWSEEN
nr:kelch repeat-containing protein [uncultured Psychroserpens sp.]